MLLKKIFLSDLTMIFVGIWTNFPVIHMNILILLKVCPKYKQFCELYKSVEFMNMSYFIKKEL